jgi:hypothetical protein
MKPYQLRQAGIREYFKLAIWDARSFTFRDGKVAFATEQEARDAACKPGKYRISVVSADGRRDLEPFTV